MTATAQLLEKVRCPQCHAELDEEGEGLVCAAGHRYPILDGVPSLLADGSHARVSETFSAQWTAFEYGRDLEWNQTLDERVREFLHHLDVADDPSWLRGKEMLDAGCGTADLSNEIAVRYGAVVTCIDVSESVFAARRQFGRTLTFFRGDVSRSALRPASFDVVYAAGVLHHTPDTQHAFDQLAPVVREGGRMFVWLYRSDTRLVARVKSRLRRLVAPLPPRTQQAAVDVLAAAAWVRHGGRRRWRDHRLVQHDYWTPRYRWEHVPEEISRWFEQAGFSSARLMSVNPNGFGVLGER